MRVHQLLSLSLPAVFVSVGALVACGGSAPPPETPPAPSASAASVSPTPSASSAEAPSPTTWSSAWPMQDQANFMKQRIVPKMSKVFQAHDATRYATFGCKTCHGPEFKNPHDFLPHLTFKDGKITAFADKPDIAKFMMEMTPQMAAAMGEQPMDPQTHQGFSCRGCHAVDQK